MRDISLRKWLEKEFQPPALVKASLEWIAFARGSQYRPGTAGPNWLVVGGRGSGKTRLGSEWVNALVRGFPPFSGGVRHMRIALVGETLGDVREVMVDGPSGIAAISRWNRPRYETTRRRLLWDSGAVAQAFSSEDPESLRGPQFEAAWCDELGCPAVDKGPNQPNVFPDLKSYENASPYFSSGGRSDVAQARFLQAHLDHWDANSPHYQPGANPLSQIYGGRMVDTARICLWAWDARPFPAFPVRNDIWKDSDNWHRGHWLNGRLSGVLGEDLVEAILADHGLSGADVTQVGGSVAGYLVDAPTTARAALEPFTALHGIAVRDENGVLAFSDEETAGAAVVEIAEMVVEEPGATLERTRVPDHELPEAAELTFLDPFHDYQMGVARVAQPGVEAGIGRTLGFPGSLEAGAASALLSDWIRRMRAAREGISFSVPAATVDVVPGALVRMAGEGGDKEYLVTQVETGLGRKVTARRIARSAPTPWRAARLERNAPRSAIPGAPHVQMLDLPVMPGGAAAQDQFRLAAFAEPWREQAVYSSPEETGFQYVSAVISPATMGELIHAVAGGMEGRLDRGGAITVNLYHGSLSSVSTLQLLNGANTAAIRSDSDAWEVVQFAKAEEIAPSIWELSALLRGQLGTGDAMAAGASAGASFVLLDDAVVKAGLAPEQAGLPLNWMIGPAGQEFGSPSFVRMNEAGGVRAHLPLAPVHLRLDRKTNGDAGLRWIRRGRIGADNWIAEDIPLGEESERYRVEIASPGGAVSRSVEVTEPGWIYPAAQIAADFPVLPAEVEVTVRQISASAGAGLPASTTFLLAA